MLTSGVSGAEREYQLDPVHSRIAFQVDHLGFSRPLGTFSGIEGTIFFDRDDPTRSRVEVRVPVVRLDLGDPDWNQRMQRRDFFDLENHPLARFTSTSIEALGDDRYRVFGTLTLRETSSEVTLDTRLNRRGRHPLTLRSTLGFSATASLLRSAFGMTAWKSAVGDRVDLIIELEAKRGRQRGRADDDTDDAPADADKAVEPKGTPRDDAPSDTVPTSDKENPNAVAQ